MSQPERAVRAATALGHTVEWDPPGLSSMRRWTCTRCRSAALDSGTVIYGSAVTDYCDPTGRGM